MGKLACQRLNIGLWADDQARLTALDQEQGASEVATLGLDGYFWQAPVRELLDDDFRIAGLLVGEACHVD